MERNSKKTWVSAMRQEAESAEGMVVASFRSLSAAEVVALRAKAREAKARIKVTQNRLARIALKGTKFEGLSPLFKGATFVAFGPDPVSSAKVVYAYAKANDKVAILGGAMGAEILDFEGVKKVALLPTLDEARAKILAVLSTPAGNIARALKAFSELPAAA